MTEINFEVIAGTYEEFLLGYKFTAKEELVQSFASHDHSASVRSIALSGHYLASGASDDRIIIYDLKSRKEHCMLTHHESTVTCLQFTHNHSHLIAGSSDGVLSITRVGNWQLEKNWEKAHKGASILDIAVHSSGKLALTLGADCTLRTWNLVKGRQAYIINLQTKTKDAKSLDKIVWADDGIRFILSGGKCTEIWSIETGGGINLIDHNEKVSSCIWFSDTQILVGYDNGHLALVDINTGDKKVQKAHSARIKTLTKYIDWVVSASSTGEIKVWNCDLEELTKQDSGCRVTCLCIVPPIKVKKEEEEVAEQVLKQVKRKPIKKSSVIVEIEGSDDEVFVTKPKGKNKKHKRSDLLVNEIVSLSKIKHNQKNQSIGNCFEPIVSGGVNNAATVGKPKHKNKKHNNSNLLVEESDLSHEPKTKKKKRKLEKLFESPVEKATEADGPKNYYQKRKKEKLTVSEVIKNEPVIEKTNSKRKNKKKNHNFSEINESPKKKKQCLDIEKYT